MAKLVAPEGFILELDSERMTFGHSEEIEVPLLPELGVEDRHFSIVRFGEKHFIEHIAAPTAPTLVNGSPVSKCPLENGDEIAAGDLVLVFQSDDEAEDEESQAPEATVPSEPETLFSDDTESADPEPTLPKEQPALFAPPTPPAAESLPPVEAAPPEEAAPAPLEAEASLPEIPALPASAPTAEITPPSLEVEAVEPAPIEPSAPKEQAQAPEKTDEKPVEVFPIEEPVSKKPGPETQRIQLASAISSALSPGPKGSAPTPNTTPASRFEDLEHQSETQSQAAKPSPALPQVPSSTQPTPLAPPAPVPPSAPPAPAAPSSALPSPVVPKTQSTQPSFSSAVAQSTPVAAPVVQPLAPQAPEVESPSAPETPPIIEPETAPEEEAKPKKTKSKAKAKTKQKKVKKPRSRAPRKPLFPFLRVFLPGLITLALIGAAGLYAWENYFKPEDKPKEFLSEVAPETTYPSALINAQDVLRFLPNEAELASFVDVRTAYGIWSSAMNPNNEPIFNPVDDFVIESTGVSIDQINYICVAGAKDITSDFVGIIGFDSDLNPPELFNGIELAGSRLINVKMIDNTQMRVLERDGMRFELVLADPRTVLITSVGRMGKALEESKRTTPQFGPVTAALGKFIADEASFAITGTPESLDIATYFETFGCPANPELLSQIEKMKTVSISAAASRGVELKINFTADTPEQAGEMTPIGTDWLVTAPQAVRDSFRRDFPDDPLPSSLDRMLQGAEWASARNVNRIRLTIPRRDVASLVRDILVGNENSDPNAKVFRRDAQNFVSIFQSAVQASNPDLPKAGSVEKAMEMLIDGVRGRDSFSDTEFRYRSAPSKEDLAAVAEFLEWKNDALEMRK